MKYESSAEMYQCPSFNAFSLVHENEGSRSAVVLVLIGPVVRNYSADQVVDKPKSSNAAAFTVVQRGHSSQL
jgi:hypothetical protein